MFTVLFGASFVMELAFFAVVIVGIVAVMNRKALANFWESGSAQLGKAGQAALEADPVAIFEKRAQVEMAKIAPLQQSIAEARGNLEGKKRQVADGEREVNEIDAKIRANLASGNEARAATLCEQLNREKKHLEDNKTLLQGYITSYEDKSNKMKLVRQQIIEIQEEGKRLKVDLKDSETDRNISKAMQSINVSGPDMDGLKEAKDMMQRKIDANRGFALAAADTGADNSVELAEKEAVSKENAMAALQQYKDAMKK